jgi:hypothetical protein
LCGQARLGIVPSACAVSIVVLVTLFTLYMSLPAQRPALAMIVTVIERFPVTIQAVRPDSYRETLSYRNKWCKPGRRGRAGRLMQVGQLVQTGQPTGLLQPGAKGRGFDPVLT